MKKKKTVVFVIIILTLFMCSMLARYYDGARVSTGHEPKVVRYVSISPNEPYENNVGAKMGSWFMKYEKPTYQDISIEVMETNETILVTGIKDISALVDCLTNQKYFDEVCEGITDYKININGELYSIKSACLGINHNGKEAHITQEDMDNILNIINKK